MRFLAKPRFSADFFLSPKKRVNRGLTVYSKSKHFIWICIVIRVLISFTLRSGFYAMWSMDLHLLLAIVIDVTWCSMANSLMKFAGGTCHALTFIMIHDCKNSPKKINFNMTITNTILPFRKMIKDWRSVVILYVYIMNS